MKTREYYITNGDSQLGPFNLEQLKDLDINSETLVWYEGLADWTLVANVEELSPLLKKSPPPLNREPVKIIPVDSTSNDNTNFFINVLKNRYLIFFVIILLIVGIYFFSTNKNSNNVNNPNQSELNSNNVNNPNQSELNSNTTKSTTSDTDIKNKMTPEELKKKLLFEESQSPKKYISCEVIKISDHKIQTRNPTVFRSSKWKKDGYNIEFNVSSQATLATFYDLEFKVICLSQTGSIIKEVDFTLYEYINPNDFKSFKQKIDSVEGAVDFKLEFINAKPY